MPVSQALRSVSFFAPGPAYGRKIEEAAFRLQHCDLHSFQRISRDEGCRGLHRVPSSLLRFDNHLQILTAGIHGNGLPGGASGSAWRIQRTAALGDIPQVRADFGFALAWCWILIVKFKNKDLPDFRTRNNTWPQFPVSAPSLRKTIRQALYRVKARMASALVGWQPRAPNLSKKLKHQRRQHLRKPLLRHLRCGPVLPIKRVSLPVRRLQFRARQPCGLRFANP